MKAPSRRTGTTATGPSPPASLATLATAAALRRHPASTTGTAWAMAAATAELFGEGSTSLVPGGTSSGEHAGAIDAPFETRVEPGLLEDSHNAYDTHGPWSALSVPDGQLFLAQSALAVQDSTTARQALKRITEDGSGAAAETAKVALDLVLAIEKSGRKEVLMRLHLQSEDWLPGGVGPNRDTSAPESAWEGPADHSGEPTHDVASAAQRFATDWMLPRAA